MEENRQIPYKFDLQLQEADFSPTTDPTLRIGKARVFYKYLNRNGSFISDKFAEKLAVSAYAKPIVGTYDIEIRDFKGHETHQEAKSYGFVIPGSLAWEKHEDDDGIIRNYATYDIVIWAKYWEEAKQIFEKKQSMEIDPDTIMGEWTTVYYEDQEEYAYVYSDGVMAGLCILGEAHPPCFEGAAFFSTDEDSYKEFSLSIQKYFENGGKNAMENVNQEAIVEEQLPIAEHEEEAETSNVEEEVVVEVAEEEAPVAEEQPAEEPIVEEQPEEEPATDEPSVPAEPEVDYKALYEELQTKYSNLNTDFETIQENYNKIVNDIENLQNSIAQYQNQNEQLQNDVSAQKTIINRYESEEKSRIIEKFTGRLPVDIVSNIEENKDNMTIDEINTRLAMEYTSFSIGREQKNEEVRVPNVPQESSALAHILNKYKRK